MTTLQFKVVQCRLSVPSAVGALQHLRVRAVCRLTPLKPFKSSKVRIAMAMLLWPTRLENISTLESRHLTPFQRRKISSLLTDGFVVLLSLSHCRCARCALLSYACRYFVSSSLVSSLACCVVQSLMSSCCISQSLVHELHVSIIPSNVAPYAPYSNHQNVIALVIYVAP